MSEKKDRRSLERFEIPGTNVICRKEEKFKLFNRYSNTSTMRNLSKSGLCLELENGINIGDKLKLQLNIPGESNLHLIGHVRWKSKQNGNYNKIGIQFEPFGKGKYLNPISCLDKLRQFQKQYI